MIMAALGSRDPPRPPDPPSAGAGSRAGVTGIIINITLLTSINTTSGHQTRVRQYSTYEYLWYKQMYTIRSIVYEAFCHSVTRLLGHLVTRSLGHLVTWSLGHSVTRSLNICYTHTLTNNIRIYRSASQTINTHKTVEIDSDIHFLYVWSKAIFDGI